MGIILDFWSDWWLLYLLFLSNKGWMVVSCWGFPVLLRLLVVAFTMNKIEPCLCFSHHSWLYLLSFSLRLIGLKLYSSYRWVLCLQLSVILKFSLIFLVITTISSRRPGLLLLFCLNFLLVLILLFFILFECVSLVVGINPDVMSKFGSLTNP